jgi:hypothetical protein
MNMNIRKMGATLLGATMAGAALLAPAMAATTYGLQDYPVPFVDNGNTNFLIVVGQNSNPADIVGAVNVAVRLGGERGELVSCGGSTTVSGAVDKDLNLNEATTAFGDLNHNKLTGFQHGTLRWNSKDVDIDERMRVDGLNITTSSSDKDLGSDVFLGTVVDYPGNFNYTYVIDDADFDYTLVNSTTSKKLNVKFLDKSLEITAITNGTSDQVTFRSAEDVVLGAGETTTVSGSTVKINSIGQSSASVTVGGVTKIIADGDEYDFDSVKVQVNSILYTDDVSSRQVDLSIGTDIETTVTNGDSMELFGEPSDESDAEWVWIVNADNSDTSKFTLGGAYHQKLVDHKDDLRKVGEYFYLPNNYSRVSINKLSTEDYAEVTGDFDNFIDIDLNEAGTAITTVTGLSGFVLASDKTDTGFRVNVSGSGWVETDHVYLLANSTNNIVAAYDDSDNKKRIFYQGGAADALVSDQIQLFYQDTNTAVKFNNSVTVMNLNFTDTVEGDMVWAVNLASLKLGTTQSQADVDELKINGVSRGTVENDYRTQYGYIVRDPKSNGDSDKLDIAVPSEQIQATIIVEGPQASVTGVSGSSVKKAVPIVDNIARLDTEVTDSVKQTKNLILVGGPCVNSLTAQALGLTYPTCGAASTIPQGAAMIKLVNNAFSQGLTALVVAGWDAENTRAACTVLQQFSNYVDLTGTGVEVDGTTTPTLKALQ